MTVQEKVQELIASIGSEERARRNQAEAEKMLGTPLSKVQLLVYYHTTEYG